MIVTVSISIVQSKGKVRVYKLIACWINILLIFVLAKVLARDFRARATIHAVTEATLMLVLFIYVVWYVYSHGTWRGLLKMHMVF
jgi:hypothetical protein